MGVDDGHQINGGWILSKIDILIGGGVVSHRMIRKAPSRQLVISIHWGRGVPLEGLRFAEIRLLEILSGYGHQSIGLWEFMGAYESLW